MRVKNINFTTDTVDEPLGYIGEHNETQLLVTPPTELTDNTDIATYRLAFCVNGSVYYSEATPKAETFTVDLWQDVTAAIVLYIQVEGNDADGELIAKSQRLAGKFLPSVEGKDETADFTAPLISEISANTAARHTHSNKTVLDELDEDINGDLTYKGNGFATDAELALKQDILTAGNNITIDSDNVISADIDNTREIATAGNPYISTYTPAELKAFYDAGLLLTYTNKPLVWGGYEGSEFHFGLVYTSRNGDVIHYWTDAYVNASKVITLSTEQTAVRSVNSKLAGNANGNVTLQAGDISAASGWTPSANTDLATKKYVDDNAGGMIVTLTENSGIYSTTAELADIYDAFIAGKPVFITVSGENFYMPLLAADFDNGDYRFWAMATEAVEADAAAETWFAAYNNGSWQVDEQRVYGLPNVTSADENKFLIVSALGGWEMQTFPTIPDISGCEVTSNKVTSLSNTSTDTQYPSAKCVYDELTAKQNTLTAGTGISIVGDTISATGGSARLPSAYQEVEYIESSGTQYIDTEFLPTDNFSLYMTLEMPPVSAGSDFYIFGSAKANSPYRAYSIGGYNSLYHAEFGNTLNANFFSSATFVGTTEISYNNGNISITDGTTTISQDLSAQSHSSSAISMYIFACNNSSISGGQGHSSYKFKEATIYNGSALVRHFVPCYNKTTNDIGLFDLVNYKFYGNNGTGTFTKGADV